MVKREIRRNRIKRIKRLVKESQRKVCREKGCLGEKEGSWEAFTLDEVHRERNKSKGESDKS